MTEEVKQKFNEWLEENGGKEGALYQTFPDEELEKIFLTAYEKNKTRVQLANILEVKQ